MKKTLIQEGEKTQMVVIPDDDDPIMGSEDSCSRCGGMMGMALLDRKTGKHICITCYGRDIDPAAYKGDHR